MIFNNKSWLPTATASSVIKAALNSQMETLIVQLFLTIVLQRTVVSFIVAVFWVARVLQKNHSFVHSLQFNGLTFKKESWRGPS